jgi:hypothetical protein
MSWLSAVTHRPVKGIRWIPSSRGVVVQEVCKMVKECEGVISVGESSGNRDGERTYVDGLRGCTNEVCRKSVRVVCIDLWQNPIDQACQKRRSCCYRCWGFVSHARSSKALSAIVEGMYLGICAGSCQ